MKLSYLIGIQNDKKGITLWDRPTRIQLDLTYKYPKLQVTPSSFQHNDIYLFIIYITQHNIHTSYLRGEWPQ